MGRFRGGCIATVAAMALACGGGAGPDGGADPDQGSPDGGRTDDGGVGIEEVRVELPGLDGPVDVIVDDRGMPHIYGSTIHDVILVQGYLMAADRFAQMEFIRRGVVGTLAEVLAGLDPSTVQADRDVRQLGLRRWGLEIVAALGPEAETVRFAEAFVEGINLWVSTVARSGEWVAPRGLELINVVLASENYEPWTAADVFSLARFQAVELSLGLNDDINRSTALAGVRAAFPVDDQDEARAARAGLYGDFFSTVQARVVSTRNGFPNVDPDTGSRALLPPGATTVRPRPDVTPLPDVRVLRGAARFLERLAWNPVWQSDSEHIGSNSWVVSGAHTASGAPILSNDPHLSLTSPGVWWYVHLNTAEMGGEDMINAEGVAFAGLPGVVLGFNDDLAWGATTTGYDVTDLYQEEVTFRNATPGATEPTWVPSTVRFQDADVEVQEIEETIRVAGREPIVETVYFVPHHGPIILSSIMVTDEDDDVATGAALSYRYTGEDASDELAFFTGLLRASTVEEALAAQDSFRVGAQNFSFVARDGDIAWSTESRIPIREFDCTFQVNEDGTVAGISPGLVLPWQGGFEWTEEDLDSRFIPHDVNPDRGFIANANQDNVGLTNDGNPCNGVDPTSDADDFWLGNNFATGYRMARIVERLEALVARGDITTDDMRALQGETESSLGNTLRAPIVASLDAAIDGPRDPALQAYVDSLTSGEQSALSEARTRLSAWTFATPSGHEETDEDVLADSVATSIFNVVVTQLIPLAFADESEAIGIRMPGSFATRMLEWSMANRTFQEDNLYTYRATYLGVDDWNDTVVWDDLGTEDTVETRDERVARAVVQAFAWLEGSLGSDPDGWTWGRLHTVRYSQLVPPVAPGGSNRVVDIPVPGEEAFPFGFPRPGDYGAVDVLNFDVWHFLDEERLPESRFGARAEPYRSQSGPSQRLVVEMTPDGPGAFNSLPGGQQEDPDAPHHRDEAALWWRNLQPQLNFTREQVEAAAERELEFVSP
ncbi:MAG: penicillin acylase family protein [Sandaracinaceae bacterium]